MSDPRAAYDRWVSRKRTFWLAIGLLAVVFGAQVLLQSLNSGIQTGVARALVVAAAVALMGALFLHLVERDLHSRLEVVASAGAAVTSVDGGFVVRPTPWKTWYYLWLPILVVGTATVFLWTTSGDSDGHRMGAWICFIFSLLFTPVFIGLGWLFVHNARLELTDQALVKTSWRRARKVVDRSAIARVLRLAVDRSAVNRRGTYIARYWVFTSADSKALAIVNRSMWPMEDLELLVGRLGVPVEGSWDDVLKPKQVRREIKGFSSWFEAHPSLSLIGLVLATLVVAVVLISILGSQH